MKYESSFMCGMKKACQWKIALTKAESKILNTLLCVSVPYIRIQPQLRCIHQKALFWRNCFAWASKPFWMKESRRRRQMANWEEKGRLKPSLVTLERRANRNQDIWARVCLLTLYGFKAGIMIYIVVYITQEKESARKSRSHHT